MSITPPKVILRLGSHAEKEYFEKLAKGLRRHNVRRQSA